MNEVVSAIFGDTIRTRVLARLCKYPSGLKMYDLFQCSSGNDFSLYRELRILDKSNFIFRKISKKKDATRVYINLQHPLYKSLSNILCYNDINDENRSQQSN